MAWLGAPAVVYPASGLGELEALARADMESASQLRQSVPTAGKLPGQLSASSCVGLARGAMMGINLVATLAGVLLLLQIHFPVCAIRPSWPGTVARLSGMHSKFSPSCWPTHMPPCCALLAPVAAGLSVWAHPAACLALAPPQRPPTHFSPHAPGAFSGRCRLVC